MVSRTINKFQIESQLGSGAMGTVWKAWDTVLRRPVAIKFLTETLAASPEARQRFLRGDARAAAALDHPNIATVYEAGEQKGELYIAYKFIEGKTVRQALKDGPLKLTDTAKIARGISSGLAHAHQNGVLHRDITSGNVMISTEGGGVLVDFGLARRPGVSDVTVTGARVGTLAYMAPEVIGGGKVDERSDLYGLGVVLYEMVTGHLPFESDHRESLQFQILRGGAKYASEWNSHIPDGLDRILSKLLEANPSRRFESAEQLTAELDRLESSGALQRADEHAEVTGTFERWQRSLQRGTRRVTTQLARLPLPVKLISVTTAIAAVYLSISATTGFWPFALVAMSVTSVAVLPLENTSLNPEESSHLVDGVAMALVNRLSKLPEIRVLPWRTTRGYRDPDAAVTDLAQALDVDVLLSGSMVVRGDHIEATISLVDGQSGWQLWGDSFFEQLSEVFHIEEGIALQAANQIKGRLSSEERDLLAQSTTDNFDAYDLYLRGAEAVLEGDRESTNRALDYFRRAVQIDNKLADAYLGIGTVHTVRYYRGWEGGEDNLLEAESSFQKALALNPDLDAARQGLTRVYFESGEGEKCLRVASERPIKNEMDSEGMLVRAYGYTFGGLPEKAVPLLRQVMAIEPENGLARYIQTCATAWSELYEESLIVGADFLDRFGPRADAHMLMAFSSEKLGRFEEARYHHEQAVDHWDFDHPWVILGAGNFFEVSGDTTKAIKTWTEGLEIANEQLSMFPGSLRMHATRAWYNACLGNLEAFKKDEEAVLQGLEGRAPSVAVMNLALAEWRLGNKEKSFELIQKVPSFYAYYNFVLELTHSAKGLGLISEDPEFDEIRQEYRAVHDAFAAKY